MNIYYILIAFLGLFSLIFLTIGTGILSNETKKHREYTKETTARVKELKKKDTGKPGSARYYPVFEYRANGQFLRVESRVGSDKPPYKEGDEVKIFYNPESRRDFYIPGSNSSNITGIVFTVIGILLVLVTLYVGLTFRK